METDLSILLKIREAFDYKPVDIKTYSPLTLAYIGDGIYDLVIRTLIVEKGNRAVNSLHKSTSKLVNAGAQCSIVESLHELLTPEEQSIYRRGRNAKSYTTAKNASISDYRKATGFEALLGYLYLQNDLDRIIELVKIGLEKTNLEG